MNNVLAKALQRQCEIQETATAENRDLSPDEKREFDNLQAIIDEINESNQRDENHNGEEPTGGEREFTPQTAIEIMEMCRSFGMDAEPYIRNGMSIEQAREAIMGELMKRSQPIATGIHVEADEADKFRAAAVDGILLRCGIDVANPADGANRFRGLSMREIATECCEREATGDFRHMSADDIYTTCARSFYNPEAAFPAILDDVVKKSYIEGLTKSGTKFEQFVKFGTLSNFKKTTNHEYVMSLGGKLDKVPENGELSAYVPKDVKMPERQLDTYGKQFTMSRKAFIDDDIGLITSMPKRYAAMSMRTQNELVYNILLNNTTIYDGKKMFDTSHNNTLTTGTGITLAAVKKMIYMIGIQKDAAGNQLALTPDLFIVPLGMGADVYTLLASPTIHTSENTQAVNPYANMPFTVVEDVTLNTMTKSDSAIPWFMGVKGEFIQIDYLNGQKEANIRRSEQPGKLGFVWDIYHDFGVSPTHTETICRNPGTVITGE